MDGWIAWHPDGGLTDKETVTFSSRNEKLSDPHVYYRMLRSARNHYICTLTSGGNTQNWGS